ESAGNASDSIKDVGDSAGIVGEDLENASESSKQLEESLQGIDGGGLKDTSDQSNELAENLNNASAATEALNAVTSGLASAGLATTMLSWADSAGNAQSQFSRLENAMSNNGMNVSATMDSWKSAMSSVADITGRSAGAVREHFIAMANLGITNSDLISSSFKGIASAAYQTNSSIEGVSSTFNRLTLSGALQARSLVSMGLSMEDFAKVMGVSVDNVTSKFKEMDVKTRMATMNSVLAMKYGSQANQQFKNSWEGLKTEADKAMQGLARFAGDLLLPTLIPATKALSSVVNGVTGALRGLPGPLQGVLSVVGSVAAGFTTLVLGISATRSALSLLNVGKTINDFKKLGSTLKSAMNISKGADALGSGVSGSKIVKNTVELQANSAALLENTAALKANNLARATGGGAGGAAKGISQIGSAGAAAGAAAPGAAAGATGFAAISASMSAMLVPLIAISGVIAIMIPIIAGLVIEVLLFVRLIGEVVKALGFDKLNLKPAIEGIKQIGLAMFELSKAFAALTLVNIIGVVYNATGGIIGTSIALGQFWIASKEIESVLSQLNSLKIDNSAVAKVNLFVNVLIGITEAMKNMAGLNVSGLVTFLTGGVGAIKANINNIVEIGKSIQGMNIPSIDASKVVLVKALAETVKSLSEASQAVDNATGWFNEKVLNTEDVNGIQATLRNLVEIAKIINVAQIPVVAKDKVVLVKALADVIKPLSDASQAIDSATGWFNEKVLNREDVNGIRATLNNLVEIAKIINSSNIPNVGTEKIEAIKNINNVIQPIASASKSINDNVGSITAMPSMATPFKNAIDTLYSINQHLNSKAFSLDTTKIQAITSLKQFIDKIGEIGGGISNNIGKLANMTANANTIRNAINELYSINQHVNSKAFSVGADKIAVINTLKTLIQSIISTLSSAGGVQPAAKNLGAKIPIGFKMGVATLGAAGLEAVNTVINAVKNRNGAMQSAGNSLGSALLRGFKIGADMHSPMAGIVAGLDATINHIKGLTGQFHSAGKSLGEQLAAGYTDEEKQKLTASQLLNSNRGSVLSIFKDSNVSFSGMSAAGGEDISKYKIEYPNSTTNNFYLESLITDQNAMDKLANLINKINEQNNMRT
ncbi:MAG: hypothetical protein LBU40_00230, partial [Methanobrevibacter sp.]|nr:hypothetical protein [Methanobrevibacter sp.]